jgi:Ni/Fe-hydrogenase subunit HybB-like protein
MKRNSRIQGGKTMSKTVEAREEAAEELDLLKKKSTLRFVIREMKPKGSIFTPFNIITIPVIITGLVILYFRFVYGLGSVTNLSQEFPWGFWIGFDVVTGVAFAAGAYIITFAVYIMGADKYRPIVKVTVLNGFLAYVFYAGALVLDLGRPWNIINPIIGNSFGYNSVLFLVAWHFLLYMMAQFIEFSPVVAQWLGQDRARHFLKKLTLGAVIFGITLSLLHQSGLGALFLLAKSKIHPLWYTEFIPLLFVASSIPAGLSMVLFESSITHRVFSHKIDPDSHHKFEEIQFGLAKGAALSLFVYYFFKAIIFIHGHHWSLIGDFWGVWYFVEVIGFVLVPCVMYARAYRNRNTGLIRIASIMTLIGIVINRLNISIIAFNWQSDVSYYPSWQEIVVTLMIISIEIWAFRWVVSRMRVLEEDH